MPTSECPRARRCHVQGKGLKTWGKTLPHKMISDAATTSVQLIVGGKRVASGTLIWNNVVLCCFHTIANQTATDFEILLGYEFSAATAPGGHADEYTKNPADYLAGTPLATTAQAKVAELLEQQMDLDLAFLRIVWTNVKEESSGMKTVKLPRRPDFPVPSGNVKQGDEVVAVGHPWTDAATMGEVSQGTAGVVSKVDGPKPGTTSGIEFTYSSMMGRTGFSGAGVFNKAGEIVGVYQGRDPSLGVAFVNLSLAAASFNVSSMKPTSPRLRQWLGGGSPLMRGEKTEDVILIGS
jgi:hypothetical protein